MSTMLLLVAQVISRAKIAGADAMRLVEIVDLEIERDSRRIHSTHPGLNCSNSLDR